MTPDTAPDLLLTEEAAALLRFDGPNAVANFFKWAYRHGVPRLHRGRTVLWEKRVLLDFLHGKKWTRERGDEAATMRPRLQKAG